MSFQQKYMKRAIKLAKRGLNNTAPNPNVGCVLVKDKKIIGEGYHKHLGGHHAEINAIIMAKKKGFDVRGATAYVTLEPCSHFGKTPPCTDTLIDVGVSEVVIGSQDPNPKVSGIDRLRTAGINVIKDVLSDECEQLNLGFFKRMSLAMPWVTLKMGMSIDAKIATSSGESKWITSKESRDDVQNLRSKSCAIMTSSATVIADNPRLNVRLKNTKRQPKRIIVDSNLNCPTDIKLFDLDGEIIFYHSSKGKISGNKNTKYVYVGKDDYGHSSLNSVLSDLAKNQYCNSVLVEAGGAFAAALLKDNLVDEIVTYSAPILLGINARNAFDFIGPDDLDKAKKLFIYKNKKLGNDLKVTYRFR